MTKLTPPEPHLDYDSDADDASAPTSQRHLASGMSAEEDEKTPRGKKQKYGEEGEEDLYKPKRSAKGILLHNLKKLLNRFTKVCICKNLLDWCQSEVTATCYPGIFSYS